MNSYMRQTATPAAQMQHSFLKDKRAWENAIALYQGPDPLDHWWNYICWYENHGHGDPDNKFRETLERCLTLYEHSDYYKQDVRMIRLWLKYIDMQSNPLHFYQVLHQRGVGKQVACFYIGWAMYYESINALKEAEAVYNLAFQEKAQPYADLHHAHSKFAYTKSMNAQAHNQQPRHVIHHYNQTEQQHMQTTGSAASLEEPVQMQNNQTMMPSHSYRQQISYQLHAQSMPPQMLNHEFQQPQSHSHQQIYNQQQSQGHNHYAHPLQQHHLQQQQSQPQPQQPTNLQLPSQQRSTQQNAEQQNDEVLYGTGVHNMAMGHLANNQSHVSNVMIPTKQSQLMPGNNVPIEQQLPAANVAMLRQRYDRSAETAVRRQQEQQQHQHQQQQLYTVTPSPVPGIRLPRKFVNYCRNNHETWQPALFLEEPYDPQRVCHYNKTLVYPQVPLIEYSPEEIKARRYVQKQIKNEEQPPQQQISMNEYKYTMQQQQQEQEQHTDCPRYTKSGTFKAAWSPQSHVQQRQEEEEEGENNVTNNNNNNYLRHQQHDMQQIEAQQQQQQQQSPQSMRNWIDAENQRYNQTQQQQQQQHCATEANDMQREKELIDDDNGEEEEGEEEETEAEVDEVEQDDEDNDNEEVEELDNNQTYQDEQETDESEEDEQPAGRESYTTTNNNHPNAVNTDDDLEDQIEASTIRFTTAGSQNKTIKIRFKKERPTTGSSNKPSAYTIERIYQPEVVSPNASRMESTAKRNGQHSFHPYLLVHTSTPKGVLKRQRSKMKRASSNKFTVMANSNSNSSSAAENGIAASPHSKVSYSGYNSHQTRTVGGNKASSHDNAVENATFNDNANYSFSSAVALDNSNCSLSNAVGRLNFRDANALNSSCGLLQRRTNVADVSTYQESSYFATQHNVEAKEQRLAKAMETIERHLARQAIDPFNSELCRSFLTKIDFPQGAEDDAQATYKIIHTPLPKIANTRRLNLPDGTQFSIDKEIGRGSYGSVYKATDINSGSVVALKYQKPANTWEIYICDQVLKRIAASILPGLMNISTAVVAPNASIIATEFSPYGSLLDVNNKIRQATTKVMHESLVMHFSAQICNIIHHLHHSQIIHADIKPDNFLLMRVPSTELHFPSLRLIDFGCAIDMSLFPDNTKFRKVIQTDGFTCIEMQEGRCWSYETDLFCIAGTVHVMLFGEYMQLQKRSDKWDIKQKLPRYLKKNIWCQFFGDMLNLQADRLPDLNALRCVFEEEVAKMDSELQNQMRTLSNILHRR